MSRVFDRGAIIAAYIGIGMAVTMAIGFLLVIPIEPIYLLLSLPAGMIIGYYANARAGRERGAWRRIVPNSLLAGAATGLTLAVLLLGTRALFFYGDSGYPDFNRTDDHGVAYGPTCRAGADCVYQRYLQAGRGPDFVAAGVTDPDSFTAFYWREQFGSAGTVLVLTAIGGLGGAGLYGVFRPKPETMADAGPAAA